LSKRFGALPVTCGVDLVLPPGARHALIGPNGAGKTTLVNLITGALAPDAGEVLLDGEPLTALDQARRSRRGLARTFQVNQLFRGLSVLENVCLAVAERVGAGRSLFRPLGRRSEILEESLETLRSLELADEAGRLLSELAYGRQRLVELAIALSQRPRVLLLDEPAAGVPSSESRLILDAIDALDPDIAVLLVEHDREVVFRVARRISVLVSGAILTEGTPEEIAADSEVRAVYLGEAGV
jgi:ABC-type branched-subunit amino acid transport system ATPase component